MPGGSVREFKTLRAKDGHCESLAWLLGLETKGSSLSQVG